MQLVNICLRTVCRQLLYTTSAGSQWNCLDIMHHHLGCNRLQLSSHGCSTACTINPLCSEAVSWVLTSISLATTGKQTHENQSACFAEPMGAQQLSTWVLQLAKNARHWKARRASGAERGGAKQGGGEGEGGAPGRLFAAW